MKSANLESVDEVATAHAAFQYEMEAIQLRFSAVLWMKV